jgi:hypothetical protein
LRLGISARTVEKYRDSLRRKHGADTVAQLVALRAARAERKARPTWPAATGEAPNRPAGKNTRS